MIDVKKIWRSHAPSLGFFTINIVGTLAPFWISALFVFGIGRWEGISQFWLGGEFYLYSTALSTQAFYAMLKYRNDAPSSGRTVAANIILSASVLVGFVSVALYAAYLTFNLAGAADSFLPSFTATASLSLIILASVFVYSSDWLSKHEPDVRKGYEKGTEEIKEQLT